MSITWDDVIIKQKTQSKKLSEPTVSVVANRLSFNAASCDLLENIYQYEWVDIKQGIENNHIVKLGLSFLHQKGPNSLHVIQKVFRGKKVDGINLYSKALVHRFFGSEQHEIKKTKRFRVEKINANTLAIDLTQEL